jgi:hypothetical protein
MHRLSGNRTVFRRTDLSISVRTFSEDVVAVEAESSFAQLISTDRSSFLVKEAFVKGSKLLLEGELISKLSGALLLSKSSSSLLDVVFMILLHSSWSFEV